MQTDGEDATKKESTKPRETFIRLVDHSSCADFADSPYPQENASHLSASFGSLGGASVSMSASRTTVSRSQSLDLVEESSAPESVVLAKQKSYERWNHKRVSSYHSWPAGPNRPSMCHKVTQEFDEMIEWGVNFNHLTIWSTTLSGKRIVMQWDYIFYGLFIATQFFIVAFGGLFIDVFVCWVAFYGFYRFIAELVKGPIRFPEHFFVVLLDSTNREHGMEVSKDGVHYFYPEKYHQIQNNAGRPRTQSSIQHQDRHNPEHHRIFTPLFMTPMLKIKDAIEPKKIHNVMKPYMQNDYKLLVGCGKQRNCQTFALDLMKLFGEEHYYVYERNNRMDRNNSVEFFVQAHRKRLGCKLLNRPVSTVETYACMRLAVHFLIAIISQVFCSIYGCGLQNNKTDRETFNSIRQCESFNKNEECEIRFYIGLAFWLWVTTAFLGRIFQSMYLDIRTLGELTWTERHVADFLRLHGFTKCIVHQYREFNDHVEVKLHEKPVNGFQCLGYEISKCTYYFLLNIVMAVCFIGAFAILVLALSFVHLRSKTLDHGLWRIIGISFGSFTIVMMVVLIFIYQNRRLQDRKALKEEIELRNISSLEKKRDFMEDLQQELNRTPTPSRSILPNIDCSDPILPDVDTPLYDV